MKEANKTQRALSLALEALEEMQNAIYNIGGEHVIDLNYAVEKADVAQDAIKAIEEALVADLSAPKQEQRSDNEQLGKPVAWISWNRVSGESKLNYHKVESKHDATLWSHFPLYTAPQPKQEQGEPVLWAAKESMFMWGNSDESGHPYHIVCKGKKVKSHQIPLYTTPQQRTWERPWASLTDEDKDFIAKRASVYDWHDYEVIEAIEAKLKAKNGFLKEKNNGT
jgi:hypothetical protein